MLKDNFNKTKITKLTDPASATATVTSAEYDATDDQSVSFYVTFGECGDTLSATRKWTCKLQHSSTSGGALTDFVAADYIIGPDDTAATTFGLVDGAADDDEVYGAGVSNNQTDRFFKVVVTLTGTNGNGTPITIHAVSEPTTTPVGNNVTP